MSTQDAEMRRALQEALGLNEDDLASPDVVAIALRRRGEIVKDATQDAVAALEWHRERVKQAAEILHDLGVAREVAPGIVATPDADGWLTEAQVVELLSYPVRWVRHRLDVPRSGKGKEALYPRAAVLAYKHERDAAGWLTLAEAEARLTFPYLTPAEVARRVPSVKVRGQLRFPRLEVERQRPDREAAWKELEALGPDGRRAREERIREQVREALARLREPPRRRRR